MARLRKSLEFLRRKELVEFVEVVKFVTEMARYKVFVWSGLVCCRFSVCWKHSLKINPNHLLLEVEVLLVEH